MDGGGRGGSNRCGAGDCVGGGCSHERAAGDGGTTAGDGLHLGGVDGLINGSFLSGRHSVGWQSCGGGDGGSRSSSSRGLRLSIRDLGDGHHGGSSWCHGWASSNGTDESGNEDD